MAEATGEEEIMSRMMAYVESEEGSVDPAPEPDEDNSDVVDEAEEQPEAGEADGSEAEEEAPHESETEETEEAEPEEEPEDGAGEDFLEIDLPGGGKARLTLDEARNGYLRQDDYTRKTQALAEGQREFQNQVQAWEAQKAQQLALLSEFFPARPEYDPNDPVGSTHRQQEWDQQDAKRQSMIQAQQRQAAENRQQAMKLGEARLLQAIPEWRDPKKASVERAGIASMLLNDIGYRQDELEGLTDHRAIVVARLAKIGMDSLKATADKTALAKKKVKQAPKKPVKPGAATAPKRGGDTRKARLVKAHRNAGTVETGVNLLLGDMLHK